MKEINTNQFSNQSTAAVPTPLSNAKEGQTLSLREGTSLSSVRDQVLWKPKCNSASLDLGVTSQNLTRLEQEHSPLNFFLNLLGTALISTENNHAMMSPTVSQSCEVPPRDRSEDCVELRNYF